MKQVLIWYTKKKALQLRVLSIQISIAFFHLLPQWTFFAFNQVYSFIWYSSKRTSIQTCMIQFTAYAILTYVLIKKLTQSI